MKNAGVTAVLAMGPGARRLAPNVIPAGMDVIGLAAYGEPDFQASWQAALTQLASRAYTRDLASPTFTAPTARSQLPRIDLPYGFTRWVGTLSRSAIGLRLTNMRPWLTEAVQPEPPTEEPTPATAGSARMMSSAFSCMSTIAL